MSELKGRENEKSDNKPTFGFMRKMTNKLNKKAESINERPSVEIQRQIT